MREPAYPMERVRPLTEEEHIQSQHELHEIRKGIYARAAERKRAAAKSMVKNRSSTKVGAK